MVSTSDCYAGGLPIKFGILPILKHAYMHMGKQLTAMLAVKMLAGVALQVIYHIQVINHTIDRIHIGFENPGQTSTEVQDKGTHGN